MTFCTFCESRKASILAKAVSFPPDRMMLLFLGARENTLSALFLSAWEYSFGGCTRARAV